MYTTKAWSSLLPTQGSKYHTTYAKCQSCKLEAPRKRKSKNPNPAIETEDLVRLKSWQVLSLSCNPPGLLRNLWFHVTLFFCRRGGGDREGQRNLKKQGKRVKLKFDVHQTGNYGASGWCIKKSSWWSWPRDFEHERVIMRQKVRNRRYQRYNTLKLYLAKLNPKFEAFSNIHERSGVSWRQHVVWRASRCCH